MYMFVFRERLNSLLASGNVSSWKSNEKTGNPSILFMYFVISGKQQKIARFHRQIL